MNVLLAWFSFGVFSWLGAVLFPILYLVGRYLRSFAAYIERTDPPKDRVGIKLILAAILGFVFGCLVQTFYVRYGLCQAQHINNLPCYLGLSK